MKKALLIAPMGSVHRRFNKANIRALKELGYEIHLLANFDDAEGPEVHNSAFVKDCLSQNIVIHTLPFIRSSLLKNLRNLKSIERLIKEGEFTIVHAHTETGGILLRLVRCYGTKKICYTPHGMSFYKGSSLLSQLVYKPIERWICCGMTHNLAMNQEEYDCLIKWKKSSAHFVHGIGLNVDRIQNVDMGAKKMIRSQLSIPDERIVILSIGELNTNKNHSIVIKSISKLDEKLRPYYVICGVGPLLNELQKLSDDLGVSRNVKALGFRSDIPEIISASDIFIFPSFHEGLPVSVMEAMAGGLPVIASRIRGNVDLINDGYNGFLFDPSNATELTQKIEIVLKNGDLRAKMGNINRDEAFKYSENVVKSELIDIYK